MLDVVIVGSGPAGTSAALALARRGVRTCILDVGKKTRTAVPHHLSWYDERASTNTLPTLIGERNESLCNLVGDGSRPLPVKLTAPHYRFVTDGAEELGPLRAEGFVAIQSFAAGGFANAWGAGLYRFDDDDLEGIPIRASALQPFYDLLTREIGISGCVDDLSPYFGAVGGHLDPLRLSANAARVLKRYESRRVRLNRDGFFVGRPRLGVLSQPYNDRTACDYSNHEFWYPGLPYLYTPAMTLERLKKAGQAEHRTGILVRQWSAIDGGVRIFADDLVTGESTSFDARYVLLAAGAINSGRIALRSLACEKVTLPLLDNPAFQIGLLIPRALGGPLERRCFGLTQLNAVYSHAATNLRLQASILEVTSPARATFFERLPLSLRGNLQLLRDVLPAMLATQVFFPCRAAWAGRMSLDGDILKIRASEPPLPESALADFLRCLRRLAAVVTVQRVPLGLGIHYAGTLAMTGSPTSAFEADRAGRLGGAGRVFVTDGAAFSQLPAKNYSLAMMANAMRVADHVADLVAVRP